jgi:hypothetical protein
MNWPPRSGLESIEGMIWLPRLLDKARRVEAAGGSTRCVDGYLYGNNDFIDKRVLRFLRIDDTAVSQLLREHSDDATVATIIIQRSGRTSDEVRAFGKHLRKTLFDFALLEADEGRMTPGLKRTCIRVIYNFFIMPITYAQFQRAERKR